MVRRSVLFSPGDQADKLRKAPNTGADVVVFDLEDAVVPDRKAEARETVRDVLDELDADCEVCVRVNPVDRGASDDLDVVLAGPYPDSVMLPKTAGADDVRTLAHMLDHRDADLPVLALVESAAGVLAAEPIAAVDATGALLFGAEDLAGDIGATRTAEGAEVAYARQHVLLAARAAGVDAIDTLYPAFEDDDGLRRDAEFALQLGYDGKMAIHPAQVSVLNEAFRPDDDRIDWARRVVATLEDVDAARTGVSVVDGEMVDAPMVRQAERILERADEAVDS